MRKIIAAMLTLGMLLALMLPLCALADGGDAPQIYFVNNPNPADRLHLRIGMDQNELSRGKYYNGTRVEVLDKTNKDWYLVQVGNGDGYQQGYMMSKYLMDGFSATATPETLLSRMPIYVCTKAAKMYQQPERSAKTFSLKKGIIVYLMGFTDSWWHVMADYGSEYVTAFMPANDPSLTLGMHAYISNPDKTDRLHLRAKPEKSAQSLGKYYNGAECEVLGQTLNYEYSYVNLYGREGYMANRYLSFQGEENNTYYGVVNTTVTKDGAAMRSEPKSNAAPYGKLRKGTEVEVFGVLEKWLHVRFDGIMAFIQRDQTDYVDDK